MVLLSGDGKAAGEGRSPSTKHLQPPPFDHGGPSGVEAQAEPLGGGHAVVVVSVSQGEGAPGEEEVENYEEDYEDLADFSDLLETRSLASEDSFYPPRDGEEDEVEEREEIWSLGESEGSPSPEPPPSFFRACCTNNAAALKTLIRQGPDEEHVRETDRNKRTGLIVACYQGFVDIVIALAQCPHIDVNWQDNEGNTALITAAQAGHITITQHLLNYYPGLDIEKRNVFGFTALMKSAMQGRSECVRALMLAGANINATDPGRGFTSQEWACFTGRIEAAYLMQRLMNKPSAEQFCDHYELEWPKMKELLAKAAERKTCLQRISEGVRSVVGYKAPQGPEEDGVLDHMVRVTTGLRSSFVAIACRTVCPGSPPGLGKRRPAVQEILRKQRAKEIRSLENTEHFTSYERLFQNSRVTLVTKKKERRASLQPFNLNVPQVNIVVPRKSSLLPLHLLRRSSVRPGFVIPKVRVSKAPAPTFQPEKVRRKSSASDGTYLEIPKWRYKELKEERKKAEEEEKKKAEEAQKQKQRSPQKSKT
uniref:Ankyrin repeat domain 33B n=1 Tax=Anolis carolinensis TaxID=28377 RepID=A0A803SYE1_ANOCA|nr:PREDICTED: ankyrin repeat domain-containing protein 33B isoform X1 [Anolis carolinensis]|eukprot:XP_003219866.1 PREDICTED: ankyrin repeat domain-containing protein 33B isoform X1 [Anolis carolinensis]